MKRIISAVLVVLMVCFAFAGCGSKTKRELYNVKLSKYVKLGDYKDIKVDKSSDTFKGFRDDVISSDVKQYNLYVKKTEGTVADKDKVNIDYTGKKDGVAFEGGTDKGYDLEIGSNSFIEGFESGLVGKTIGSTVDLNLTFPENYQSTELAGKAVVFTVKINYVTSTDERKPEDFYKEIKFDSLEDYNKDVDKRAAKDYLLDAVKANSKVKDYPKDDIETLYKATKSLIEQNIKSQYNVDFNTYLGYMKQTEEEFKKDLIDKSIKPEMDSQMIVYYILDKEKLGLNDKDIDKQVNDMVKSINNSSVTADKVKEYYGNYYFESSAVNSKVLDYMYDNAKIS